MTVTKSKTPRAGRVKDLHQIAAAFLRCRTLGHAWKWTDVQRNRKELVQGLRCTGCDTTKRQQLTKTGRIVASSYSYAPGHLVKGLGYLDADDRAALRLMALESASVSDMTPTS